MNNFYCQKTCLGDDFSIDEWNDAFLAMEKTNLSEAEKGEILHPKQCKDQCFDCMAIVGNRRIRTRSLISNTNE